MPKLESRAVRLDFGAAATVDLLSNLSGVVADGDLLWLVSDEGRSVHCLTAEGDGYIFHRHYRLDDIIDGIPGKKSEDEVDLESVDLFDDKLWLCGSHCRVRKNPERIGRLNHRIRSRPSRRLLSAVPLAADRLPDGPALSVPGSGKGSLRRILGAASHLEPFIDLPSKENGLDIEGLVCFDGAVFLGLRGPVLDGIAVSVRLELSKKFRAKDSELNFLDLGGLAIRDLTRHGEGLLVLAGPTGDTTGPYRLYRWSPRSTKDIQRPDLVFSWPATRGKPEGICPDPRIEDALIVVYDAPNRIKGNAFLADRLVGL